MTPSRTARPAAALMAATAAALVLLAVWAPAAGATSYRYWSFWHGTASGGWSFSSVGAGYVPKSGTVDGWRFAVSAVAGSTAPRAAASFAHICAGQTAPAGGKLVALVVDYGTTSDAPPGQHPPRGVDSFCAPVPASYTSGQILASYAPVTDDGGLVCAIDGYPLNECGVIVHPSPTLRPTTRPPTPHPTPSGTVAGVAGGHSPGPGAATSPAHGSPAATSVGAAVTPPGPTASATGGTTTVAAGDGSPSAVAVGPGGVHPDGEGSGRPPLGAILGGSLVVLVAAAALLRSARSRRHGEGAPP